MSDADPYSLVAPRVRVPHRVVVACLALLVTLLLPAAWALARIPLQALRGGTVELSAGMTAQQLALQLRANHGLAMPVWMLRWYTRASGIASRLRSGEYLIQDNEPLGNVLRRIVRGDVIQRRVAIIEGWTFDRALEELHRAPKLAARLIGMSDEQIRSRLGIEHAPLEGMFLPDTYTYAAGMSDEDVLKQARDRLQQALAQAWRERAADLPYQRPYDALIVASLVEKETGLAADRDAIAAVFVERLRRGMKLQTDPSVIYALGKQFNGNLTRADLVTDDPYNTYRYAGLPPSPIALVGRAALHATLHPRSSAALYFVARGDGSSEFSDTLVAHEQAVTRYQRAPRHAQINALRAPLPPAQRPPHSPQQPLRPQSSTQPSQQLQSGAQP